MTLRLGFVGAGWIAALHLEALARLGRTELVAVVSRTVEGAGALTGRWGGTPYPDLDRMLDEARLDVAYVCVPPFRAVAIGERLVERGIPFLAEKPLAAADAGGPPRLAAAIERAGLVVAVGYHLRALDILPEVTARLVDGAAASRGRPLARSDAAAGLVGEGGRGRRPGGRAGHPPIRPGPAPARRGGGRRGRLDPRGCRLTPGRRRGRRDGGDPALRARGRRLVREHAADRSGSIEVEFASDGLLTTLFKRPERGQGDWHAPSTTARR